MGIFNMQIENNLTTMSKICKVKSLKTFRERILQPLFKIQNERGINCGIVKIGEGNRPTYLFLMDRFINSLILLNREFKCEEFIKEEKSTTLTSQSMEQDIEQALTKLIETKQ
jgi:hypothetical protein